VSNLIEVWIDIPGFEGLYKVSNLGNVKSLDRPDSRGYRIKGKLKKLTKSNNGYTHVSLHKEGKPITKLVHRVVAEAFMDNPENKRVVNHLNGNKTDNRLINLEWATYGENVKHAYDNNLIPKGENHYSSKLSDQEVKEIRRLCSIDRVKQKDIAERYGVDPSHISDIVNYKKRLTA
jgi:predicted XRE-type DNA-binding protein